MFKGTKLPFFICLYTKLGLYKIWGNFYLPFFFNFKSKTINELLIPFKGEISRAIISISVQLGGEGEVPPLKIWSI